MNDAPPAVVDLSRLGTKGHRKLPAGPAIRRVRACLDADPDLTMASLARQMGISPRTLAWLLNAPPGRMVWLSTYNAIMSVRPQPTLPTQEAFRVRAAREVEALMAQGWTLALIGEKAGVSGSTLNPRYVRTESSIKTSVAVHKVFLECQYQLGPSRGTAAWARYYGYLPWSVWDGRMDDPLATPDLHGLPRKVQSRYRSRMVAERRSRRAS